MYNLTDEQIKQIINDIIEEEKKEHNLDTKTFIMTPIQFYQEGIEKILKPESPKFKMKLIELPYRAAGANIISPKTNETFIFIFQQRKIKKVNRDLYHIINTTYHEIRHVIQHTFDKYSYNGFVSDIDHLIQSISIEDYWNEHSKYSFEIGANLYAAEKTKEYLQKHFPDLYEREKNFIEASAQQVKFYYIMYDLSDNIEIAIQMLKNELKENNATEISNLDDVSPILPIFLNPDLSFKKNSDIISNEKYKELDKRIVYAFLSNKTFLETTNLDNLTEEELNLVHEALNYTNNMYLNQIELLSQEKNINLKAFLKQEKNILKKYSRICNYYMEKLRHKLNAQRNDEKKEEHMKSIPTYLEKTETIINQRSKRGYITINIFYIVGLLLSISTIIYLLVK